MLQQDAGGMLRRGAERRSDCLLFGYLQSALTVTIHQRLLLSVPYGAVDSRHAFTAPSAINAS